MPDQPAPVPMVRQVDDSLGDTATLVALGVIDEQPIADPDPPAPPSYGGYAGPVIETA